MKIFVNLLIGIFIIISIISLWQLLFIMSNMEPTDPVTVELFSAGFYAIIAIGWATFFNVESKNYE